MSKIYNKYLELKHTQQEDTKYLFKSGIFYIFVDQDAEEMAPMLGLKLTNLNENVIKCGFPTNNISKYVNVLNELNISFRIIDENLEKVTSLEKYLNNEKILSAIKKIQKYNIDEISPKQAYDILYEFNSILKESEI